MHSSVCFLKLIIMKEVVEFIGIVQPKMKNG